MSRLEVPNVTRSPTGLTLSILLALALADRTRLAGATGDSLAKESVAQLNRRRILRLLGAVWVVSGCRSQQGGVLVESSQFTATASSRLVAATRRVTSAPCKPVRVSSIYGLRPVMP